ncbi:hypothetical protein PFLUV_G00014410 [Perca fluviatilis]|uniref:Ubiquitin-like protease family profile domain-containing protein n=1 Tax=Perca fluviatilis TaxID=8168 RepID=A0A6A5FSP2_PERFL|nr:hypothetical protein PFLUV_G00014410 [Perca fluviatilis]
MFIDSYPMTNIWNRKTTQMKFINPTSSLWVILGAVHEPGHWIFAAISPMERRSLVLDSLGNAASKVKQCLESTRSFMRLKGFNVSRWTANTVKMPRLVEYLS